MDPPPVRRAQRLAVLGVFAMLLSIGVPAQPPAAPGTVVLGTSQAETTYAGKLQRKIYIEAFRRLGVPLQLSVQPLQRLTLNSEQGSIDGEVARVHSYAEGRPQLVRVEESVYDLTWGLFTMGRSRRFANLAELATGTDLRVSYLRGVGVCEHTLKAALPATRLFDVSSDQQAFNMLRFGRVDLHCTGDLSAITLQHSAEFKDVDITRRALDLGSSPLHPFLNQRHAALAPKLASTLRQMKAEGLIERYKAEALQELAAGS
ncbi:transporter substrate-binding domain-containing protein [Aquincola sp. S2]|uniref:Transporter substrate-binding domain-containing protein n=1 Tax=Pseudaquabacterium terrae TaxID=2732868 RepID=A0ABX2EMU8_9BURK|nr:transporter substrate-binding domain-containing protein [Aquabacterium terrae]NRF70009.1 transporter substrate-binding domain-containing protein [Aquabacterium terrae]